MLPTLLGVLFVTISELTASNIIIFAWRRVKLLTVLSQFTVYMYFIISPKFENFGDIMFLVAPPSPPPPHANACTGHNFGTNTPIKFIFAIAIKIPDYKNPMIFVINRKNKMASWRPFCIKMLKKLVASLTVSQIHRSTSYLA